MQASDFKVGWTVRLTRANGMAAQVGATALVTGYDYAGFLSVNWVRNKLLEGQMDGGYEADRFEVIKPRLPTIASDLKLTPQAKAILAHLKRGKTISPMKALVVHSISRLASCIHEIRKVGYDVKTGMARDDQGHKYASYSLAVN